MNFFVQKHLKYSRRMYRKAEGGYTKSAFLITAMHS